MSDAAQTLILVDEIDLKTGEYVIVIDEQDDASWKGINESGEIGLFPSNSEYVKVIDPISPARPPRGRPPTIQTNENKGQGPISPPVASPPPYFQ